jgi:hypothetical protein
MRTSVARSPILVRRVLFSLTNFSNRRVRTRMHGGVGGVKPRKALAPTDVAELGTVLRLVRPSKRSPTFFTAMSRMSGSRSRSRCRKLRPAYRVLKGTAAAYTLFHVACDRLRLCSRQGSVALCGGVERESVSTTEARRYAGNRDAMAKIKGPRTLRLLAESGYWAAGDLLGHRLHQQRGCGEWAAIATCRSRQLPTCPRIAPK